MNVWKKLGIAVVIIALLWFMFPKTYEKFRLEGFEPQRCEHYVESCVCFGSLKTLGSYPPQFVCKGIGSCKDVDYVLPEGCTVQREISEGNVSRNLAPPDEEVI